LFATLHCSGFRFHCHSLSIRVAAIFVCFFAQLEDGTLSLATRGVQANEFPENPEVFVQALLKSGG